jgi:hypothetical protein
MTDPYVDAAARLKRSKAEAEENIREREQKPKPLKPARSKAELTRVRQGWVLICLNSINVTLGILTVLKVFGVI